MKSSTQKKYWCNPACQKCRQQQYKTKESATEHKSHKVNRAVKNTAGLLGQIYSRPASILMQFMILVIYWRMTLCKSAEGP